MQFIGEFLLGVLVQLYLYTNNLGLSIIAFTLLVRTILFPLSLSSIKSQKQMREVQPELKKLREKHKGNVQALQAAQMELYKKYNINPLAGCLPQLLQIFLLIILYQVLTQFLGQTEINGTSINTSFFWMDLAKPDSTYILPILSGLSQLVLSIMILPGGEVRDVVPNQTKNKKLQEENKKEEDMAEMAATMQKQMLFLMPIMTGVIAIQFPSGLALYWVFTTLFSIVQQYTVSGAGGLREYSERALALVTGKLST